MDYSTMKEASSAMGEHNDCAVKAVALTTGVEYRVAHAKLKEAGRINRQGTHFHQTEAALDKLGYKLIRIDTPAKTVRSFKGDPDARYLIRVSRHILAYIDGQVADWTAGRLHRIKQVYRVVKKDHVVFEDLEPPAVIKKADEVITYKRGEMKRVIFDLMNKYHKDNGYTLDKARLARIRIQCMDELQTLGIKRTTASTTLGEWQKAILGE